METVQINISYTELVIQAHTLQHQITDISVFILIILEGGILIVIGSS
jgi:hypothetical protein